MYPILNIFFNGNVTNQSTVISLTNDASQITYQIVCSAINSKPDISLTLYDSISKRMLSNSQNSITSDTCNSNNICTNILQVNFQFQDNSFNSMTSLSCTANSTNPLIPLISTISRNVIVTVVGIQQLTNF